LGGRKGVGEKEKRESAGAVPLQLKTFLTPASLSTINRRLGFWQVQLEIFNLSQIQRCNTEPTAMTASRKGKKSTTSKSTAKRGSGSNKRVAKTVAKTVAKAKKPARKPATKSASKTAKKSNRNSVDSILSSFAKERTFQQSKLTAVRKKMAQLEAKTKAFQAEIISLKEAESTAVTTIDSLDVQRDIEVRSTLEKLGVKLAEEAAPKPKAKAVRKPKAASAKKRKSKSSKRKKTSASGEGSLPSEPPQILKATPLFDSPVSTNGNPANSTSPKPLSDSSSDELLNG